MVATGTVQLCSRLRALVHDCLGKHLHNGAAFYADKLITFNNKSPEDILLLAQAFFCSKQYRRALQLLKRQDLIDTDIRFKHLAACCLVECKLWDECLTLLGEENETCASPSPNMCQAARRNPFTPDLPDVGTSVSLAAALCVLRGKVYEAQNNHPRAKASYQAAMRIDAYCYEAFAALIEGHLLSCEEEQSLLCEINMHPQDSWLHLLLKAKCKKYVVENDMEEILAELEAPQQEDDIEAAVDFEASDTPHHQAPDMQQPQHPLNSKQDDSTGLSNITMGVTRQKGTSQGYQNAPHNVHTVDRIPGVPTGQDTSYNFNTPSMQMTPSEQQQADMSVSHAATATAGEQHMPSVWSAYLSHITPQGPGQPPQYRSSIPGQIDMQQFSTPPTGEASMSTCDFDVRDTTPSASPKLSNANDVGSTHNGIRDSDLAQPSSLQSSKLDNTHAQAPKQKQINDAEPQQSLDDTQAITDQGQQSDDVMGTGSHGHAHVQQPSNGASSARYGYGLSGNLDVQACRADWLFHRGQYEACYRLTTQLLQEDSYALQVLPLHVAVSCILVKQPELFQLGHRLTDQFPDKALSWYTVACYYMCNRQYDTARRFLARATSLEEGFAPAWIAYGHAFSALDERDQAMAAYRTAFRLFPGLHMPLLGMGMEYAAMNNLQLAERMLLAAHELCPSDPATCHELGVVSLRNRFYEVACVWLRNALTLAVQQQSLGRVVSGISVEDKQLVLQLGPRWEPTVIALAHCLRKQGALEEAVQWYRVALGLAPGQASTMSALGLCYQLQGNTQEAVQVYHAALALQPDSQFTSSMLHSALIEYSGQD